MTIVLRCELTLFPYLLQCYHTLIVQTSRWQQLRDLSIVAYKGTYSRLNVAFDEYSGESRYWRPAIDHVMPALRASCAARVY